MTAPPNLNTSAWGNSVTLRPGDLGGKFRILFPSLRTYYGTEAPPPASHVVTSSTEILVATPAGPLAGNLWFLRMTVGSGGSTWLVDCDLGQSVALAGDTVAADLISDPLPDPSWLVPASQRVTAGYRPGTRTAGRLTRSLPLLAPVVPPGPAGVLVGKVPPFAADVYLQAATDLGDGAFYFASTTLRFLTGSVVVAQYAGTDLALARVNGTPVTVPRRAETWSISITAPGGAPTAGWLEFGLAL
jgi:hypothetical protein